MNDCLKCMHVNICEVYNNPELYDFPTDEECEDFMTMDEYSLYKKVQYAKWLPIEILVRSPYAKNHYCSSCEYVTNELTNYCPNCGASMVGNKHERMKK